MMLGLLLARAGVDVTVMEKHADFLRDFRGDTVHASTLRLLDELGLGAEFAAMPHREIDTLTMNIQGTEVSIDLSRIPGPHKHIALVPQWDFLELLAAAAEKRADVPAAAQHRGARADSARDAERRVIGVSYRDADGQVRELRADLTVACDGRLVDAAQRDWAAAEELRRADGRVVVPAAARRRRPARPERHVRQPGTRWS